jgi:signal transduction histidine kinase
MTEPGKVRLAWSLFIAIVAMLVAGVVFNVFGTAPTSGSWESGGLISDIVYIVTFSLIPIVGLVLATRRPANTIGWLMLGIGVAFGLSALTEYGPYALEHGGPGAAATIALSSWLWVPTIGVAGSFLLLLFPDGHLPSPRWRWFAWTAAGGMVLVSLVITLTPGSLADSGYPQLRNPLGIDALEPVIGPLLVVLVTIPLAMLGSALSLVLRYRRSPPTERVQIRWLASAAVVIALVYAVAMAASAVAPEAAWLPALQTLTLGTFALIPIAIGIAILRYHLYDIDLVIRKAVIVAAMTALFTLVYVAIVGGIGAAVGATSTPALSFAAAGVVALLFQPALVRARRFADRIVYGNRATPYEVLSEFSERVGETYAAGDLLPGMAFVIGEGTGATRADVWLRVGDTLRPAASWPADATIPQPLSLSDGELPALPNADIAYPVRHQGELYGALAVAKPASDPLSPTDERLIADLAGQAGLVLRNARLTSELEGRIDELRALQKRLVSAQDQERRRLERNIHDGAQQQLVALSVKLRLAEQLADRDVAMAKETLVALRADTQDAIENIRDLARGIYPPLLADQGLAAAIGSQVRKVPLSADLQADGITRYPSEVEAAAYFCTLEALQNVTKYAGASNVSVRLAADNGSLTFQVTDDGRGFDATATSWGTGIQGMADRVAAVDGSLDVTSAPGAGTTVVGRIPIGHS